jgi:predicted nucleic-acid-binding protein
MIALDTNVVVRIIVNDDPDQVQQAQALLKANRCVVPITVVLETSWVLEASYGLSVPVVASSLRQFLGIEQVEAPHMAAIEHALQGYESGLDFADALHRALPRASADALATFDQAFIDQASDTDGCPVVHPADA